MTTNRQTVDVMFYAAYIPRASVMVLPQVHLRKPCHDFTCLSQVGNSLCPMPDCNVRKIECGSKILCHDSIYISAMVSSRLPHGNSHRSRAPNERGTLSQTRSSCGLIRCRARRCSWYLQRLRGILRTGHHFSLEVFQDLGNAFLRRCLLRDPGVLGGVLGNRLHVVHALRDSAQTFSSCHSRQTPSSRHSPHRVLDNVVFARFRRFGIITVDRRLFQIANDSNMAALDEGHGNKEADSSDRPHRNGDGKATGREHT